MPSIPVAPEIPSYSPTPMFDTSIYGKILDNKALSNYAVRILSSEFADSITGLLTNNLNVKIDSDWEAINHIDSIPIVGGVFNLATRAAMTGGMANPLSLGVSSKKIYQQSGYLNIGLNFRIVDWQGNGQPITSSFFLAACALPKKKDQIGIKDGFEFAKYTVESLASFVGISKDDIKKGEEIAGEIWKATKDTAGMISNSEGLQKFSVPIKAIGNGVKDFVDDSQFMVFASSPQPITVQIGDYFEHSDMVITGLNFEFSRQMTSAGPLWVDINLDLSSRRVMLLDLTSENPTASSIGFALKPYQRVFENTGPQFETDPRG